MPLDRHRGSNDQGQGKSARHMHTKYIHSIQQKLLAKLKFAYRHTDEMTKVKQQL